ATMPVLGSHGDAHDVARPSPERLHERHAVVTERQHVGTPILDHRAACRGVVVANCPLCILSSCPVALGNKVARHLLGAGNAVGVQVLDDHRNGDGLNNGAHVHSPGVCCIARMDGVDQLASMAMMSALRDLLGTLIPRSPASARSSVTVILSRT